MTAKMISDDADCTIGCWEDGNRVDWMRVGANCGGCGWFGLVEVPPPGYKQIVILSYPFFIAVRFDH